jgi:hypothetical protein
MLTVFQLENLERRDHLGEVGVDRKIKSEWILRKIGWMGRCGMDATGSG